VNVKRNHMFVVMVLLWIIMMNAIWWMLAPGNGPPDRMLAKPWRHCFWQPIPSGLNLVVAAVLRDSLCVVSLLPCVTDYCMLYTVCKVEWFVLTIIIKRLLLLL